MDTLDEFLYRFRPASSASTCIISSSPKDAVPTPATGAPLTTATRAPPTVMPNRHAVSADKNYTRYVRKYDKNHDHEVWAAIEAGKFAVQTGTRPSLRGKGRDASSAGMTPAYATVRTARLMPGASWAETCKHAWGRWKSKNCPRTRAHLRALTCCTPGGHITTSIIIIIIILGISASSQTAQSSSS